MTTATENATQTYRIVRFRKSGRRTILHRGVSLAVARLHCNDPRTRGKNWFDGFEREGSANA
jgi:hypothetical protein